LLCTLAYLIPLLQLIPDDFEYSAVNGDAFVSTDATTQIKEGTEVRIKIVGVRADPLDMVRLEVQLAVARPAPHACQCPFALAHVMHLLLNCADVEPVCVAALAVPLFALPLSWRSSALER
jgi:hypothetical protein